MSYSFYEQGAGSWSAKHKLLGFRTSFEQALTAFHGLWLFAIVGVAVIAVLTAKRSKSKVADLIFRIHKFWLAILLAIL